jgi:hypothetical protein
MGRLEVGETPLRESTQPSQGFLTPRITYNLPDLLERAVRTVAKFFRSPVQFCYMSHLRIGYNSPCLIGYSAGAVSFPRKRDLRQRNMNWTPACAGVTACKVCA